MFYGLKLSEEQQKNVLEQLKKVDNIEKIDYQNNHGDNYLDSKMEYKTGKHLGLVIKKVIVQIDSELEALVSVQSCVGSYDFVRCLNICVVEVDRVGELDF